MTIKQFFTFLLLLCAFSAVAQVPNAFNYQSLVRDAQGNPLSNQTLNFEVSIVQIIVQNNMPNNVVVYGETQSKTTNPFGLVDIKVGQGTVFQGNFAAINWGNGAAMIRVKVNGVVLPESPIVPVPIALYALKSGSGSGGNTTDSWTSVTGTNNIFRASGNVGIGTNNPAAALNVDPKGKGGILIGNPSTGTGGFTSLYMGTTAESGGNSYIQSISKSGSNFGLLGLNPQGGDVGIGTDNPKTKLEVSGGNFSVTNNGKSAFFEVSTGIPRLGRTNSDGIVYYEVAGNEYHMFGGDIIGDNVSRNIGTVAYPWNNIFATNLRLRDGSREFSIDFKQTAGGVSNSAGVVYYEALGRESHVFGGNIMSDDSQSHGLGVPEHPFAHAYIRGLTRTGVLEITGGDVAEARHSTTGKPLPKGTVVVFDEKGTGKIQLTNKAYDKKVAGVISGAGKYFAGVTLLQEELAKGAQPVAQVGTVEVLAVGPVAVGDLLTSSSIEGHAMTAKNARKAFGCIIGKATTSLKKGERGLVEMQVEKH